MLHVLAIITTKPGMRSAVLEAFRANMPDVHAEEGCIEYVPVVDFPSSGLSRRNSAQTPSWS
jgi:quinol monooxygenase YgiN